MIKIFFKNKINENTTEDLLKTGEYSNHKDIINVGTLVNLNTKEKFQQYATEIWSILELSYEPLGGLKSYRGWKDFINKGHFAKIVIDENDVVLACEMYRKMEDSYKVVCGGCIQTPVGKLALQQIIQDEIINFDLHYWAEVSEAVEHYFKKYNGFPMPNVLASEILGIPSSEITLSKNDKVHYERKIGIDGEPFTKMIFGVKNLEILNKAINSIDVAYGDFMKEVNKINESNQRYTIKQAVYIIENIYRLHEENGFNELIPKWYNALQDALKTLNTCGVKSEMVLTYIEYAKYLLAEMPLLKVHKIRPFSNYRKR